MVRPLAHRLHRGRHGRGRLGRLAPAHRASRWPDPARRRRHLRHQRRATARGLRAPCCERAVGETEPDRDIERDGRGGRARGGARVHDGDQPPQRRDRGHDHRRPCGRVERRPDQGRRSVTFRAGGQVQPAAHHRGGVGGRRPLRGKTGVSRPLEVAPTHRRHAVTEAQDRATRAARAGLGRGTASGGTDLVTAPSLSAVRTYADLDSLDADMESRRSYRRYGDSSVVGLEAAIADLETPDGAETPVARVTASGQAALGLAITLVASPKRSRVVVVRPCYSGTDALIAGPLGNLGMRLTAVDITTAKGADHGALVAEAMGDDVCAVITEVITNPLMTLMDVSAMAAVAHAA